MQGKPGKAGSRASESPAPTPPAPRDHSQRTSPSLTETRDPTAATQDCIPQGLCRAGAEALHSGDRITSPATREAGVEGNRGPGRYQKRTQVCLLSSLKPPRPPRPCQGGGSPGPQLSCAGVFDPPLTAPPPLPPTGWGAPRAHGRSLGPQAGMVLGRAPGSAQKAEAGPDKGSPVQPPGPCSFWVAWFPRASLDTRHSLRAASSRHPYSHCCPLSFLFSQQTGRQRVLHPRARPRDPAKEGLGPRARDGLFPPCPCPRPREQSQEGGAAAPSCDPWRSHPYSE